MKYSSKSKFRQIISVSFLFVLVLALSISFISLDNPTVLETSINRTNSFEVHIDNVSAEGRGSATYTLPVVDNMSLENYNVVINKPGDAVTFYFTVTNKGDVDAILKNINKSKFICSGNNSIDNKNVCGKLTYKLRYANSNKVKEKDVLEVGEVANVELEIKYPNKSSNITSSVMVSNLDFSLEYYRK